MMSLDTTAVPGGVLAQASAGTPSLIREASFSAGKALEFEAVLGIVAGYAAGSLGAARVRARRPSADPIWVAAELRPLAELLAWSAQGHRLDVPPVPPIDALLERLRIEGAVLDGPDLVAIGSTLATSRIVTGELDTIAEEVPSVAGWRVPLPPRDLEKLLTRALDPNGEVLDAASPALQRARAAVRDARAGLIRKLEAILRGGRNHDRGLEVTMRNGRYVIPVRRETRPHPDGIVHDESATGETLFVEPTAAIELGNQLRGAVLEADREQLRVLRDLTGALRPHGDAIAAAHAFCVALDDLNARVRYALEARGTIPELLSQGEGIILREARHPLLLARGVATVPFDLTLRQEQLTLLISGPNAGGKTVLLKTVGLAAALTQSGIAPPVGAGSALPVFSAIAADIGDHQSIAADLSTFSAHVAVLRDVLQDADQGTLVLMDEIGSGTDPAEGSALASAALRTLTRVGARTIATTHLGSLKALATHTPGIVNGSLQFDPERLVPTFRFVSGVPGRSYGIAIARRLGVPAAVVADAEGEVSDPERALDVLLESAERRERELEARQTELDEMVAGVEAEARRLDADRVEAQRREDDLRGRERSAEQRARGEARRILMEARAEIETALQDAQRATTGKEASAARRTLESAIHREGEALRTPASIPAAGLDAGPVGPGQRVRFGSGSVGRVIELREDGHALVAAGSVKLVVPAAELSVLPEEAQAAVIHRTPMPERNPGPPLTEVDLRGMRADEAEAATLTAVDAAVLGDVPYLRIIHGMGTGALRDVVRRVLTGDRRVTRFAPAPSNQGGVGVTVAEFAG